MDDELKQRILKVVLAFNLVIIPYQIFFNLEFTTLKFLLGALIAGVAAAITWFVAK